MGVRRPIPLLLAMALVASACGEQNPDRDFVTGPDFKPTPPSGCNLGGLPGLVRDYFPGSRQSPIVSLAGLLADAGATTSGARNYGFQIMDSIGTLSRDADVSADPAAGAALTVELIECMFSGAGSFTYPTTALADFTKALTSANGGAYYVRGGGTGGADPAGRTAALLGTDHLTDATPTNLSGVRPVTGNTWTQILTNTQNAGSEGRALVYGYQVTASPLVYEWATVPSNIEFTPGAVVAVCDGSDASTKAMVVESSIGVLAFVADDICDDTQPLTLLDAGWGPRALAGRLARVVVDAVTPAPLQAAALARSGSGGTATTFKSKFKTNDVSTVAFSFVTAQRNIYRSQPPVSVVLRATTPVDGVATGVNGVCVYLTGANNNGQGTALVGNRECENTPTGGLSAITRTVGSVAGYATFDVSVTKTGGLVLTASSTDASGTTGVVDRTGQTFNTATFKTNVKP